MNDNGANNVLILLMLTKAINRDNTINVSKTTLKAYSNV